MAVLTLADHRTRQGRDMDLALDGRLFGIVNNGTTGAEFDPIAFFKIADAVGERRQRQRIGAQIHFLIAVTDRQRTAAPRADQKIFMAGENNGNRERAFEPLKRRGGRLLRRETLVEIIRNQMRDGFGVGFRLEAMLLFLQLLTQLAVIFDDAVMHDGDLAGYVRMRVVLGRAPMRRPTRMTDADITG